MPPKNSRSKSQGIAVELPDEPHLHLRMSHVALAARRPSGWRLVLVLLRVPNQQPVPSMFWAKAKARLWLCVVQVGSYIV
jgi:hypothetical protein